MKSINDIYKQDILKNKNHGQLAALDPSQIDELLISLQNIQNFDEFDQLNFGMKMNSFISHASQEEISYLSSKGFINILIHYLNQPFLISPLLFAYIPAILTTFYQSFPQSSTFIHDSEFSQTLLNIESKLLSDSSDINYDKYFKCTPQSNFYLRINNLIKIILKENNSIIDIPLTISLYCDLIKAHSTNDKTKFSFFKVLKTLIAKSPVLSDSNQIIQYFTPFLTLLTFLIHNYSHRESILGYEFKLSNSFLNKGIAYVEIFCNTIDLHHLSSLIFECSFFSIPLILRTFILIIKQVSTFKIRLLNLLDHIKLFEIISNKFPDSEDSLFIEYCRFYYYTLKNDESIISYLITQNIIFREMIHFIYELHSSTFKVQKYAIKLLCEIIKQTGPEYFLTLGINDFILSYIDLLFSFSESIFKSSLIIDTLLAIFHYSQVLNHTSVLEAFLNERYNQIITNNINGDKSHANEWNILLSLIHEKS